jgi:hypothetical protein
MSRTRRRLETGRAGGDRRTVPEAKELLAGYWIVEVARPKRAYEIAAKRAINDGSKPPQRQPTRPIHPRPASAALSRFLARFRDRE